jgi:AcrR family transcriptional regulator
MTKPTKPRRRGRPPGHGLSREKILARALSLLGETGIEDFSLRRLAEALGVTPMALYHYFESYDELLRGIVSAVLDEVELPARGDTDWRAAICKLLVSLRRQLLQHPHVLALLASVDYWGPTLLQVTGRLLGLLGEGGFSQKDAAQASRVLIRHTFGSLLLTAADSQADYAQRIEKASEQLLQLAPGSTELLKRRLRLIIPIDVDLGEEFAFSLECLLAGLEAHLS